MIIGVVGFDNEIATVIDAGHLHAKLHNACSNRLLIGHAETDLHDPFEAFGISPYRFVDANGISTGAFFRSEFEPVSGDADIPFLLST